MGLATSLASANDNTKGEGALESRARVVNAHGGTSVTRSIGRRVVVGALQEARHLVIPSCISHFKTLYEAGLQRKTHRDQQQRVGQVTKTKGINSILTQKA
jgi:hypothetical protein